MVAAHDRIHTGFRSVRGLLLVLLSAAAGLLMAASGDEQNFDRTQRASAMTDSRTPGVSECAFPDCSPETTIPSEPRTSREQDEIEKAEPVFESVCVISDPEIDEASGLAVSRSHPGMFWVHNDSGDSARLFLVDRHGRTRAVVELSVPKPTDWEDMCSFRYNDRNWLLIGDIGDNGRVRGRSSPDCHLLLVEEPRFSLPDDANATLRHQADVSAVTRFRFPDGPVDCEGLAVDTEREEILLITKTFPAQCALFSLPLQITGIREPASPAIAECRLVAGLPVPFATAMDVSPDGRRLAVATMLNGVVLQRSRDESWRDAIQNRSPAVLTLPLRRQGETVCFDSDGQALWLNSEGISQPLWRVSQYMTVSELNP